MATITTGTHFLDEGTARTAGEAWTINGSGVSLTVRTDTRWHSNSPVSMTGSLGSITVTEGICAIDATKVRWMAITGGSGTCSIGTTVSQGGVSGYFLGYWASLTSAPSTTIGATGWIKLREVTGGTFAAGALTGISATAAGADLPGWIEVVCDQLANIIVPRLGQFNSDGTWFGLDNTNGSVGQTFQLPTNGGGAGTTTLGAWVETGVATDDYEFWPALTGATNGWAYQHIGMPPGESDVRQQFFKDNGSGVMQLGELVSLTGATYAGTAAATGTYLELYQTLYYIWENNEVTFYGTHFYEVGEQVGLDFTAGGATADGIYTVTDVLGYQCFKVALTGSGAGGTATCRSRLSLTLAASTINVGDTVYCDFTTGTGAPRTAVVTGCSTTNIWDILYPRTAALTVGNVSVYYGITVTTAAAHNLQAGHRVKVTFTSGTGTTDSYTVIAIPTTTTFVINVPFNGGTGGSCTVDFQLGYVPESGRRVRIPNILMRQCATGTRASNAVPHTTIASRPEFVTTAAGSLNTKYMYTDWYFNLLQAYAVDVRFSAFADTFLLQEITTTPYIEHLGVAMTSALNVITFNSSALFAGFTFKNIVAMRGNTPNAGGYAFSVSNVFNGTCTDLRCGIIQYVRTTSSYALNSSAAVDCTFENSTVINGPISINYGPRTSIINTNYCDRMTGWQGGYVGYNAITMTYNPPDCLVDGLTFGFGGTIPNQMPHGYILIGAAPNFKARNFGTAANPLQGRASFRPYAYGISNILSASWLDGCKYQRMYLDKSGLIPVYDGNGNLGGLFESLFCDQWSGGRNAISTTPANITGVYKGLGQSYVSGAGVSCYGIHFVDSFQRKMGDYTLLMNEPTAATDPYFSIISGNPRFNSSGGIVMYTVGDCAEWTDQHFRKGHTGFFTGTTVSIAWMDGGTYNYYYLVQYQIDTGSGFGGTWKNFYRPKQVTCTAGQFTCTVPDATGIEIGDYVQHYAFNTRYLDLNAKVTNIVGNTLTLDKANVVSCVNAWYLFSSLGSEPAIDPSVGFRMKIRITTQITAAIAITAVKCRTICSAESKALALYPLDTNVISFTGLPTGTDMVVLEAGTTNILYQVDAYAGTTLTYTYEGADTIDVGFIKPGYIPYYIRNLSIGLTDTSLPISLTPDRNYA